MRYAVLGICLISQVSLAQDGKTTYERWDVAYLGGTRAGYVRTAVTQKADGQVGTVELRLSVARLNDTVSLGMDTGTIESTDGKVRGTFMKQYLGKAQTLDIKGVVNGDQLVLTLANAKKPLDPAPWNDKVVGVAGQQKLFRDRKVEPGDRFSYLSFEPSINLVLTTRVDVKDFESIETLPGTGKKKLLKVEMKGDPIPGFKPPPITYWLDAEWEPLRSEVEVPGLGKMTLVRAPRELALAPVGAGAKTLEAQRVVPLKARMPRAHEMTSAVYRITIKDDTDPASGFSTDGRQRPGNVKGDTFELTVQRGIVGQSKEAAAEYLQSSHFIGSDDAKVKEHAQRAVGLETDSFKKAAKIEKYVNGAMRPKAHELLATAEHVARSLEGDCTEYAMLMAAMCRAQGLPSRTAIGLVYGEVRGQPAMVFHMWTEVWVAPPGGPGQWIAFDATLGRGGIGAGHLKVSDQSWANESSMTPLLPTLNLLGRLTIDVIRTE